MKSASVFTRNPGSRVENMMGEGDVRFGVVAARAEGVMGVSVVWLL